MDQQTAPRVSTPFAHRRRPRDAATALCVWQAEFDVSTKELAAYLGCHEDHVTKLRRGVMKPGRRIAVAIEIVTEGRIAVASWGA